MSAVPAALEEYDLYRSWLGAPELKGLLDPFRFSHRMAVYRTLIETTNRNGLFGADNAKNPLWGLAFQLQWQNRSGRLAVDGPPERIDPDSPWGYGNFTLNVIPYLGAVAAGLVPDLAVEAPAVPCRFDYAFGVTAEERSVPAPLLPALADWRRYFEAAATAPPGSDDEPLRMTLWKAHKTSLDVVAARLAAVEPAPSSHRELEFLKGWCRMVDFLWAAAWPTDFDVMHRNGVNLLPERVLESGDRPGHLDGPGGFPGPVARNVRNIIGLARLSPSRYRFFLWLWRRAMRTRRARADVTAMLEAVFGARPPLRQRLRLMAYILAP